MRERFGGQKRSTLTVAEDTAASKASRARDFVHVSFCIAEGVRAKVYFKAVPVDEQGELTFLRVEETKMDFSVKSIQMGVDNVAGGNPVIREN